MSNSARSTQSVIDELVRTTGAASPAEAIRIKAKELLDTYKAAFGDPAMPIDVNVLASLRSIRRSDERPFHSPDAELSPNGAGGVTMRVNPDRPETRQRFSIAHEISHTFFPNYTEKEWCRTDARYRSRENPDEHLEMLCDIGAAELLFAEPWFSQHAAGVTNATELAALAATYRGSREATLRRFAEVSADAVAAVYFIWKLKPTQQGTIGNNNQPNLFGISPEEERREALRLRIEYSVASEPFRAEGHFLPADKSIENIGPIYEAATTGVPSDGECPLDLGQAAGNYHVMALPVWTDADKRGPNGEHAVAAILRPLSVQKPKRKKPPPASGPGLFDAF